MTEEDLKEWEATPCRFAKYWQAVHWALNIVTEAREKLYISHDIQFTRLVDAFEDFRAKINKLVVMDMFSIPLIYTQVRKICKTEIR